MNELGILIPTTPDRSELLERLTFELHRSIGSSFFRIIVDESPPYNKETGEYSRGLKRNRLIEAALSVGIKAFAFHDSDDLPGETYMKRGLEFAHSDFDCAELWGQIYFDGKPGMPFHHYLGCTHAWQDDKKYHRPPNHLNFMKLDLVKNFRFDDKKDFGEDMTWAMEIQNARTFKTMMPIPEVIYHYFCGEPKQAI